MEKYADSNNKYIDGDINKLRDILVDNRSVEFVGLKFQQIAVISMVTKYAFLLADWSLWNETLTNIFIKLVVVQKPSWWTLIFIMNSHSSIHTLSFLADSLVYIENLFDACSYSNAPVPVFRTNAHYKLSKICIIFVSGLCMEAIFITIETYIVLSKTVFDVLQISIYINSHLLSKKIYNNVSIYFWTWHIFLQHIQGIRVLQVYNI